MATRTKLAVILHADVVGSTALVQSDERIAHERIQDAFQRLSETVTAYGGIAHELRGDALVSEFERASDAVSAALRFQAENKESNAELSDAIRPEIRIGIALGEVVIADRTLTGAGVVLAQRLEQLAEPGGLCVSAAVREALPARLPFQYGALAEQKIKGFDEPVRVFFVALGEQATIPLPDSIEPSHSAPTKRTVVLVMVGLAILGGVLAAWLQPWEPALEETSTAVAQNHTSTGIAPPVTADRGQTDRRELPDKSSIAVMAFENLSSDPEQDYFARGVAEDIITDLSKLSGLFVSGRNSSFSYRGKNVAAKIVAEELGVRYLLEGSVRPTGGTLRISAQLVDAQTGAEVWAHRFDGSREEVLVLGNRVVEQVVASIVGKLTEEESLEVARLYTADPEAHSAFVRGRAALWDGTQAGANEAVFYFEDAIALDQEFAEAHAGLSEATSRVVWDQGGLVISDKEAAYESAQRSLAIRETPEGYRALGAYYLWVANDFAQAVGALRQSLELAETAEAYALLASSYLYQGQVEEAYGAMNAAVRRDRKIPSYFRQILGQIHFAAGKYTDAIRELKIMVREIPETGRQQWVIMTACAGFYLAVSEYYLGNDAEAMKWTKDYGWMTNYSHDKKCALYSEPKLRERFFTGLKSAKAMQFAYEAEGGEVIRCSRQPTRWRCPGD